MNDALDTQHLPLRPSVRGVRAGMFVLLTPCREHSDIHTIVCGQSHAWAVNQAVVTPDIDGAASPGPALAERLGIAALAQWGRASNDAYLDHAVALGRQRHFALVWKGNQHNKDFVFAPDPPFDFVAAVEPDAPVAEAATLVPEAAVREHFLPSFDRLEEVMRAVGKPPGRRRFLLGTPAPLHDDELIRRRLTEHGRYVAHAADAGADIETVRIMPGAVRRKLWLVVQGMLADIAERLDVEFVPAPPRSMDRHGCLDPRYSMGDITHGNVAYGLLMLQELAARLQAPAQGVTQDA